jgi:hypothetical protein
MLYELGLGVAEMVVGILDWHSGFLKSFFTCR